MAETILKIKLEGVDTAAAQVEVLSKAIEENKARQAELRKAIKETSRDTEEGKEIRAKNTAELIKNQKATQQHTRELKAAQAVQNSAKGSIDAMVGELRQMETAYRALSAEERDYSDAGLELGIAIKKKRDELKGLEKDIGDNRRNVGNYTESIIGAAGAFGPLGQKIAAVAQGGKMFTESMNNVADASKGAAASAGGIKGVFDTIRTGIVGATRAGIAFIATPIGAAIAALGGIIAATRSWYNYNETIRESNALIAGITGQTGDVVDGIRQQTAAMSEVIGVSQEELTKKAKVLVEQFGISYDEALQKMQTGILATNGTNEEFLQSIGEYSTFFADAGFAVEEFTGIVNAGADLGIYTDKLPDAIKEADISLREMTTTTRDALVNAFGDEFADEIASKVSSGAITTKEAMQLIATESEKLNVVTGEMGLNQQQAAQLTADLFRGAGEDAGGALTVFEALNVGLSETANELDEYGQQMANQIDRQTERAAEMDAAFKSDNFIAFQEGLQEIAHFIKMNVLTALSFLMDGLRPIGEAFGRIGKALGLTTKGSGGLSKALQFLTKVALLPLRGIMLLIEGVFTAVAIKVEQARKLFDKMSDAASKLTSPLKSIASSLGMTSSESEKATKSTGEFSKMLEKQMKAAKEAAKAQQKANEETERAAVVLQEAKERAEGYVTSLMDIVTEQQRQPLLMEAENIFSELDAETVTRNLEHVASQIEENANITRVSFRGMSLSVEEFAELSQNRLNELDRAQTRSSSGSSRRQRERERAIADEAKRIETIMDLSRTETERLKFEHEERLKDLKLFGKSAEDLTAEELAAKMQLEHEYQSALDEMDQARIDAEKEASQALLDAEAERIAEMLALFDQGNTELSNARQIAMNAELAEVIGNEKAIAEIKKRYRQEAIQDEMNQTQQMIDFLNKQIQEDLDAEALGLDFIDDETVAEYTSTIDDLKVKLSELGLEYKNVTKVDPEAPPKNFQELFGLGDEDMAMITLGFESFQNGLATLSNIFSTQAKRRFDVLNEQKEQGLITEEEFEERRAQIEKKAAIQNHRLAIVTAMNQTATAAIQAYISGLKVGVPPFSLAFAATSAGIATAFGLAKVGTIAANKPRFADGGVLDGPSHANGGIQMFGSGGGYFGEAEGGEAILTKNVMKTPALASLASAVNVAAGGRPLFEGGGVLRPIQGQSTSDQIGTAVASEINKRVPVLVVEQLRERERSVDVIESLRKI